MLGNAESASDAVFAVRLTDKEAQMKALMTSMLTLAVCFIAGCGIDSMDSDLVSDTANEGVATQAISGFGGASGSGVTASASWTWSGCCTLSDISQSVSDTLGDSNDVYTFLRVYTGRIPDGSDTATVTNSNGVGTRVNVSGRRYEASSNITGVRVIACVNDAGSDTCFRDIFVDNPNT
jgi:hypothetical protein